MRITATAWTAYTRQLARLNEKAGQLLADYIAAHGTGAQQKAAVAARHPAVGLGIIQRRAGRPDV